MNINGKIIKKCRIKKGYTQQDLADMMDVDVKTIQKWEGGKSGIRTKHQVKLRDILNISQKNNENNEYILSRNYVNLDYAKKEIDIMAIFLSMLIIILLVPIVRDAQDAQYKLIGFAVICKEYWQILNKIRRKS